MNKFFYPGTEKIDKPGLERHHQLIESSTLHTAIQSQKKVRESLPNNWIYNDNKAKEVWSELEQFESCPRGKYKPDEPSPLAKIDESAAKLRKTITNFEIQDQEFLMELMELIDDDSFVDSLDQSSILFEARYRLQQMIEEHIDFGERQANLLTNLTSWFVDVKNGEQEDQSSISSLKTSSSEDKLTQLRKLIEDYKEMSAGQIEKAENLHEDIIQNLNEKVNDCKKKISQKDLELSQLNQSLQQANSRRKNGRVFNVRDSVHYDAELAYSQRKAMELQEQLNSLRVSLSEYTKLKNSSSMREIMLNANLTDQPPDLLQNSSLKSERNSVLYSNFNTNDMDFTKLKENNHGLISVEREIEFESKLCVLANQIKNLKDDNKILSEQIMQNRQSEIVSEKRFQSVERQKKTMESALQSATKRMENMKESYERRIKELQGDPSSIGMSVNSENESILSLKKSYETKIDKMADDYRKQIQMAQQSMDKKYQKQLADVFKSMKHGDASAALEQVTTNFQQQILEMERHFNKELKDEKRKNAERVVALTKHYESIIKKKDIEIERIKKSVDSEIKCQILDVKIELDDKFNAKTFEDHENAVNEYNDIRRQMQGSIDHLNEKLLKMTRERDTLKSLIEANDLAVDLLDDLDGNIGNENEEEEDLYTNNGNTREDNILQKSLLSLKEKEIEQKVSEKFSLIVKSQKETLQEYHKYELEKAKNFYKAKFQNVLSEFREKVVTKAGEVSDRMLKETEQIDYRKEIEDILVETVKLSVFDSDYQLDELYKNPTIPLSELDNKVNLYRSQVAALASENEFWKTTLKHMQSSSNGDSKDDSDVNVIESMKAAIEKQSKRMAEIDKENRALMNKLRQLPDTEINLLDTFPIVPNEICNLIDFQRFGDNSNDDYSTLEKVTSTSKITQSQSKEKVTNYSSSTSETQCSTTTQSTSTKTSNSVVSSTNVIEDGKICCFHCHSVYQPQEISQQAVKCEVTKCPQCDHLSLMPQTDEITILHEKEEQETTTNKSENSSNKGDLSLPTKPDLTTTNNNAASEQFNYQAAIEQQRKQQQQQQQLKEQHNQELEQIRQAQEKLKIDLQFQQEQNQQIKIELDKSLQRNEQLKNKLVLYEKNFGDLEKQYIKKIRKITDDLSKLQKSFIEDSLFIVHSTQQLPNDQSENLEKKISVSRNISQMMSEIEFSLNSTTKPIFDQFIEFTNEKFNQVEGSEKEPSLEDANEALSQAENLLNLLLTGSYSSTDSNESDTKNDDTNNDSNDVICIEKVDPLLMCKLNVMKMNIDIVKEHNDFLAEIVNEVLNQFKEMALKTRQIGRSSIGMAKNMKSELKKVSHDLNSIIEQRTKAMNEFKHDLLQQRNAYDSLQEQFRTSVAAFEQLQINTDSSKDEVMILKRKEDDQIQMIDSLTNKLLDSQESNRKYEREIEELKLKIIELESDQLLITARIETQGGSIEAEDNDESYQSSHNEEENTNETQTKNEEPNNISNILPAPLPSIGDIQATPDVSFEFVPSFVIFSTLDDETGRESNRKKGFSLLPRRLALQQSKPVSMDVSPQSNSSSATQSTKSVTSQLQKQQQPETIPVAADNSAKNKHEKIRVKYVSNNFSSSSTASNARVIVPRSRPKTPMSRTASSTSSASQLRTNTPVSEEVKHDNQPALPRVISFENLVPLSEDDKTGSLIGYITHYVPMLPPVQSLEEKKKILRTSSVLISEVPPEKLRFDMPNESNANANQFTTKSMLSFGAKLPLNSNLKAQGNVKNQEPSRLPRTKDDWLEKCDRKIKMLENQLRESMNALQDERDKSHRAIQNAFKTNVELKQCQRQQKKATLLLDATKKRLQQALEMLGKSDNEVARLKKLLNEVSHIARSIEEKESNEKENVIAYDEDKYKAFPTKKRVLARANKLSILTTFEDESNRLLSVFRGVFSGLTNMAEKEIESIRKWAPKKDRYINDEQKKLISALQAMQFITSPDAYENINKNSKSLRPAIRVNSLDKKVKKQAAQKRPASKPIIQKNEPPTTFEKAIVTANMHNQKVGKSLKKGVIGRPATSHSNII